MTFLRRLKSATRRFVAELRAPAERPSVPMQAPQAKAYAGLPDETLRVEVERSLEGAAAGPHRLTRFAMYSALADLLVKQDGSSKRCLAISRSAKLARVLGLNAVTILEADFPKHSFLALGFPAESFDFCVSDQVLEHVEGDPFEAVRESFRVLRPGGYAVHTSCLLNPIHREPGDFWRFTPDALALLCRNAGAEVISTGSWGNRDALVLTQIGARMRKVPLDPAHPLHRVATANDRDWPVHTWVVARKSSLSD